MYGGLIGTHQRSFEWYHPRPLYGFPFLDILGLQLSYTPLVSGTGKATDFKFGRYIYRANPNKIPLKILEKRERGRIQGLPNFWGYPLLSQERVKLRTGTSNFEGTFIGQIGTKAHEKCWKQQPWAQSGSHENFHGTMYTAHCAVIFAIAQLSCLKQRLHCITWYIFHKFRNEM